MTVLYCHAERAWGEHNTSVSTYLDYFLHEFPPHLFKLNLLRVLNADHHRVHADGDAGSVLDAVLNCHLTDTKYKTKLMPTGILYIGSYEQSNCGLTNERRELLHHTNDTACNWSLVSLK